MLRSLRNRLVALFVVLVVVVGGLTLWRIESTLADDLLSSLDARMVRQGNAVANWLSAAGHVEELTPHLALVTGTRLTIVGIDGTVEGDSQDPAFVGKPIGSAWEVTQAQKGKIARVVRQLAPNEPRQYVVAVPAEIGVVRLAVPLGDVIDTRARMRNRLLVGFFFGFLGALFLSWVFVRAVTKPIQSMTRTAEALAAGKYDVATPTEAVAAGGELEVLARAMMHMAGEVKSRVGELTEQRDLLSVIFGGLVEGVVVVGKDDSILLANAAAKPLIGDSLPQSLVVLVDQARHGESREQEIDLVGRTVLASARPLNTVNPTIIVVLYDVTRMRALESVRREFLSNAAHELRTPVTSIAGYAETLLGSQVNPDLQKEFITTIHRNARRIADMVTDLLLLDQLGGRAAVVSERDAIPLWEVIDDAVRTAKGVKPTAQIVVDVAPEIAVLGTREGLDHVVQNLIDNAVKYGDDTLVSVAARLEGKRVRLTIGDQGPGIPKGHEERIFERFYRVDAGRSRDQGGSGLGLAIVKSHVEAMGGRVSFEHADPGARFLIELDAA